MTEKLFGTNIFRIFKEFSQVYEQIPEILKVFEQFFLGFEAKIRRFVTPCRELVDAYFHGIGGGYDTRRREFGRFFHIRCAAVVSNGPKNL